MLSRTVRRTYRLAALLGILALWNYIYRSHPMPDKDRPAGELCYLVMADVERLYDQNVKTAPRIEELLIRLTERRREARIGVAAPDPEPPRSTTGPGQFRELRSPKREAILDSKGLRHLGRALERLWARPIPEQRSRRFIPEALEWARRRLDAGTGPSDCKRWELFLLTAGDAMRVPPDLAASLLNRMNRFCPTTTRIVLLQDPEMEPDDEALWPLVQQIRRTSHATWASLEEYQAMQDLRRHRVLVDVSDSLRGKRRDEKSTVEWFEGVFSESILPAMKAKMPLYLDQQLTVEIFGAEVVMVQAMKTSPVMTTPELLPRRVKQADPGWTSLAGVLEHLEALSTEAASVWMFTDGWDDPPVGAPTLAQWLEERSCDQEKIGRWLYLQLPYGLDGAADPRVRQLRQAAGCLGYRVIDVSGPPPIEARLACQS